MIGNMNMLPHKLENEKCEINENLPTFISIVHEFSELVSKVHQQWIYVEQNNKLMLLFFLEMKDIAVKTSTNISLTLLKEYAYIYTQRKIKWGTSCTHANFSIKFYILGDHFLPVKTGEKRRDIALSISIKK